MALVLCSALCSHRAYNTPIAQPFCHLRVATLRGGFRVGGLTAQFDDATVTWAETRQAVLRYCDYVRDAKLDSRLAPFEIAGTVDALLAAFGAGMGLWLIEWLTARTRLNFYRPPLAASAIILFSVRQKLQAWQLARSAFIGTVGAIVAAVACSTLLGAGMIARSAAVGAALLWFKGSGAAFPPAAALAALSFEDRLGSSWTYFLFPCLAGHAILIGVALALVPLRQVALRSLSCSATADHPVKIDRQILRDLFDRCSVAS
jgi:hypothetical protein